MNLIIRLIKKILRIGKNTKIKYTIGNIKHHNSRIDALMPQFVEIGDNFVSAPGSIILTHDSSLFFHIGQYRVEKVKIGDNVFVGANAVILPGINIGDGAIIGAGAIVTKDVPESVVVAGNPAKIISTVAEYVNKCETKGVLYTPPQCFYGNITKRKLTEQELNEFQNKVLNECKL